MIFQKLEIITIDETLKISVYLTEMIQCHENLGDNAITSRYMVELTSWDMIYLLNSTNLMRHDFFQILSL